MIDRKEDNQFHLVSKYEPSGDQPQAIETLVDNIEGGEKAQILKGATGTGKTYTMSQVIQRVNKPTLVIAHNKTLAGQLYGEFKEFFPDNAVEYFVSYYDFYQPEAYVPSSDTYIEKDSSVNDEIDKLRHSATSALLERNDVIVVASVSCIYGLGSPKEYADSAVSLRPGQEISRDKLLNDLVDIQFERNDIDFQRGKFRVRGDVVEIFPASRDEHAFRVEFFGDEIDRICEIESLTGRNLGEVEHLVLFPATHFMTNEEHMEEAIHNIMEEMEAQVKQFEAEGKLIEAQRIRQRTEYDVEMLREMGYTNGVENYSRHMDGRKEGEPPFTLLDFFPEDFLITKPVRRCWLITVSVCHRPLITVPSDVKNSKVMCIRLSMCLPLQVTMRWSRLRLSLSRLSVRLGYLIQRSKFVQPWDKWMTSLVRLMPVLKKASVSSSLL